MNYTLKIVGISELPEGLLIGQDYAIAGRFSITSIETIDNQDGTLTQQHKGKIQLVEVANKIGKTFKGVAKGSKSQKLRWRIMERGDDEFYEMVMSKLIENLDKVLEVLKV